MAGYHMLMLRGVTVCANITPGPGEKPLHSSFDHCDTTKNFVLNEFFSKFNSNLVLPNQHIKFQNVNAKMKKIYNLLTPSLTSPTLLCLQPLITKLISNSINKLCSFGRFNEIEWQHV